MYRQGTNPLCTYTRKFTVFLYVFLTFTSLWSICRCTRLRARFMRTKLIKKIKKNHIILKKEHNLNIFLNKFGKI